MKSSSIFVSLLVLAIAGSQNDAFAQTDGGLIVYRDQNGRLTESSRDSAREMSRIAAKDGEVTVWLLLDYEIDLYLDPLTDQVQIDQQNEEIRSGFESVLQPMMAQGHVWHTDTGEFVFGPGCVVKANITGIRHLIRDRRIIQILAIE
jgi:hypothetical protein